MIRALALLGLLCAAQGAAARTYLSPNDVGGGDIPNASSDIVFTLSDGNWAPSVTLPKSPADQARVTISSAAAYQTQVMQAGTDVPLPALSLSRGQSLEYTYAAAERRWLIAAPTLAPGQRSAPFRPVVPYTRVSKVVLSDAAWAPYVVMPYSAPDGTLVIIRSSASARSHISQENMLFANTMVLRRGDEYAFQFNQRLGRWIIAKAPETHLSAGGLTAGYIPFPVSPVTRITAAPGYVPSMLRLPSLAGDRDRLVISSSSPSRITIDGMYVQNPGTMILSSGQSYHLMWVASARKWVIVDKPVSTVHLGRTVPGQPMPAPTTPETEVIASDGNWQRTLTLPALGKGGDRIVVKSSAAWPFAVAAPGASDFVSYSVTNGEEVSFVRAADGTWSKETTTARLLLTYSQGLVTRLGGNAALARQLESLRLTNEALRNSRSRLRFQLAKTVIVPDLGTTLDHAVDRARTNALIQAERDATSADAVYYEGIEEGCGLAWLNSTPSSYNMVASGSANCGTTVMRHELGHNLGLDHGNGYHPTVMSGNALPYFASPNGYEPVSGLPLGHLAAVPNEVAIVDRNAVSVARFR